MLDKKYQILLAKLAGVDTESHYYDETPQIRTENDYYAVPKDKDGWVDGNALLRSAHPQPIVPQHRLKVHTELRPRKNILYG